MLTKICPACGGEYMKPDKYPMCKWKNRKFCSRKCNLTFHGEKTRYKKGHSLTPKGHTRWDHPNVKKNWIQEGNDPWNKGKTGVATEASVKALQEWSEKHGSAFKGRKHSEESKAIIREKRAKQKFPTGDDHWNWKGGTSPLRKKIQALNKYRTWRACVFERDDYTCVLCNKRGGRLNADHIKPFSQIIEEHGITSAKQAKGCAELWDTDNGRTLCIPCHQQTDTYGYKSVRRPKSDDKQL